VVGTLLLKSLADLMCRIGNGVTRGIGAIAKSLADRIGAAANMALPEIASGGIEVILRPVAIRIAGGQGKKGSEAQSEGQANHALIMPPSR
jgi:hypothetical protein